MDTVEKKLSQMILEKKFAGTLDQGAGCLIIFDDPKPDGIFSSTLETISNISKVVDSFYIKSEKIMAQAKLMSLDLYVKISDPTLAEEKNSLKTHHSLVY